MAAERLVVRTPDGRDLEVLRAGADGGLTLLFHHGTPGAAHQLRSLARAAASARWQLVTYSRPGYAQSTPHPGRSVADVAADVTAILDHLRVDGFVTLGWSGGGPHALATAALLPGRCLAAASLAGAAPYDGDGLDWMAGMGAENIEEFGAAARSPVELEAYLDTQVAAMGQVTGEQVVAALGDLVDDVDRAALTGEFADDLAVMFRSALARGAEGWRDDDLAFVRSWGFHLDSIKVPTSVWQGAHDRMVPFAHGRWLAAHVPGARVHLYDDEGHLSLVEQLPRILDDLANLAGRAR